MAKEVVVTHEGYKKLEDELNTLRTVTRKEVAEKLKVARGYGDLSENAEYDAAKEEQAVVEARIADLEATLKVARVIDLCRRIDSLDSVELIMAVEEETGLSIPEETATKLTTVGSVIDYLTDNL